MTQSRRSSRRTRAVVAAESIGNIDNVPRYSETKSSCAASSKRETQRSKSSDAKGAGLTVQKRGVALQQELISIREGTHIGLRQSVKEAGIRRDIALAAAERWRKERMVSVEHEFDGAMKHCRDQYAEDLNLGREHLLEQVKRKKRRIVDMQRRKNQEDPYPCGVEFSMPQRNRNALPLPSTRRSRSNNESFMFEAESFRTTLHNADIRSDIDLMRREFEPSPHSTEKTPFSQQDAILFKDGALHINHTIFRVGEYGVLFSSASNRSLTVLVTAIDQTEVLFSNTIDGSSIPIYLAELRAGRFSIERVMSPVVPKLNINATKQEERTTQKINTLHGKARSHRLSVERDLELGRTYSHNTPQR